MGGRVVVLRHGETAWSRDRRHTGRTDIPLTERGRQQAREAGRALRAWTFATVLCSPLQRAVETAALAGLPNPVLDDDLVEWDYGEYDGITTAEIRERQPGWVLWDDSCPGGETVDEVAARADRAVARVRAVERGDVAVVAHGHLLRVLAARWLGQPPRLGAGLMLDTAAISVLGEENGFAALARWNDTSHLG